MEGTMFISPRINVGEKAAGGTAAFYQDSDLERLIELWAYKDLTEDPAGGGRIANPVPVDNFGINSSPVFYSEELYPDAYYVVSDARGAIIRQGYVRPYSWQDGGSAPPPGSGWEGWPKGDWFWGYQVAAGISQLSELEPVQRPVFLATGAVPPHRNGNEQVAGDRSGGLIVWAVAANGATGDNIITFNSKDAGTLWKARERVLNYSYLAEALFNANLGGSPFAYIEDNYKGEYDIRVDKIGQIFAPAAFSSKIIFAGEHNGKNNAYNMDLSGSNGFGFDIEFESDSYLSLTNDSTTRKSFFVKPSARIYFDNSFYAKNAEFYDLANPSAIITPRQINPFTSGSEDNPGNLHIIGPDCEGTITRQLDSRFRVESPNVDLMGTGRRPHEDGGFCFVKHARRAIAYAFCIDLSNDLMEDPNTKAVDTGLKEVLECEMIVTNALGNFGGMSISWGTRAAIFKNAVIRSCNIILGNQGIYLKESCDVSCNCIYVLDLRSYSSDKDKPFCNHVLLGNGTSFTENACNSLMVTFVPEYDGEDGLRFANIRFDNNRADDENCVFSMPGLENNFSANLPKWSDGTSGVLNKIHYYNVTIRGNHGSDGRKWAPINYNGAIPYTFLDGQGLFGHVEITGEYNYGDSKSNGYFGGEIGLPVETFPVKGATGHDGKQWLPGQTDYLNELCLYVLGDPLKYTQINEDGSAFPVTVDPWVWQIYRPALTFPDLGDKINYLIYAKDGHSGLFANTLHDIHNYHWLLDGSTIGLDYIDYRGNEAFEISPEPNNYYPNSLEDIYRILRNTDNGYEKNDGNGGSTGNWVFFLDSDRFVLWVPYNMYNGKAIGIYFDSPIFASSDQSKAMRKLYKHNSPVARANYTFEDGDGSAKHRDRIRLGVCEENNFNVNMYRIRE